MTDTLAEVLSETLEYLLTLCRNNVGPGEAMARFRLLQEQHGATDMDLIWETETYTQAVHYDVLLRLGEQGTVSLSFCPDRAVPWSLRHAHHSREGDLVRVNGTTLEISSAMACLDFLWDEARLIARLVDSCLIEESIDKRGIEVSGEELQQWMDAFRQKHQLYTAEDTYRWMEQHGMTHEKLEQQIAAEAASAKLRDQIADGRVEDYFEHHSSAFDIAHIARFRVIGEKDAWHIYRQICDGTVGFFAAAQGRFLAGEHKAGDNLFAMVRRRQISPEQASVIFASSPGEVVRPVRSGDGYDIISVLQIDRAHLNESTREAIKDVLFEEWLAERRQRATIEWFWGDANRVRGSDQTSDIR